MPHNATYSPHWHHTQDTAERHWLDAWMSGHINPHTLEPYPTPSIPAAPMPALATAGRP